jgi:sporulation protein YlmC with PRC-barrel domain
MFLREGILLLGAALSALTCAAAAQSAPSVKPEQTAAPRVPAVHPVGIARASNLIGSKVVDSTDTSIGEIKDLIACDNGDLIVLIERASDKLLVAAPLGTLSPRLAIGADVVAESTATVDRFVMLAGKHKGLAGSPVVTDRNRIDQAWCKTYCTYYGLMPMGQVGPDGDKPLAGMPMQGRGMECLATLLGHDVKSAEGETIGKIKDIAVDLADSKVAYVVVSTGGTLGFGETLHGIPLAALTRNAEGKFCTLQADHARLEDTAGLDIDTLPARPKLKVGALVPSSIDRGDKGLPNPR